ncbi:beta-lactamase family protein [Akkermansiaceae bacterium]|nr:beta-lactamase family protein [Akkermansiaceae bacterium]MDB4370273.1 beta-lactamase family protein [Akkermansiaceae bacterium]MDB4384113.1 beta-lactamase family protein [Akkermansiaceae bacterium]MDB4465771.1 beta-lactamase family protein [Akkermansiaceae bacterium]
MRWAIYTLVLLASAATAGKTAKAVEEARTASKIPAVGVVAFNTRKITNFHTAGTTRVDNLVEVKKDSAWHIGSDAKAMTATLMAVLVEKKLLKWETTMADVFPELAGNFHPEARKTTIIQLLSHTAGLPANPEGPQRVLSRRNVTKVGLAQKPTQGFLYSNFGYIIAGAVIEETLDTTWEKAIQDHLFKPLGITSVGFGPPKGANAIHGHWKGKPMNHDNPPMYGPAGGLHLSLSDWVLFCQDQIKGHHGNGQLLTQTSYRKLHTPIQNNYALGWAVKVEDGKVVGLQHDGSNTMWYARAKLDLTKQQGYLISINTADQEAVQWFPKIAAALLADSK